VLVVAVEVTVTQAFRQQVDLAVEVHLLVHHLETQQRERQTPEAAGVAHEVEILALVDQELLF
jgi:hypothetical protein